MENVSSALNMSSAMLGIAVAVATALPASAQSGAPWGARDVTVCAPLVQSAPPTAAQAAALVRCAKETASSASGALWLVEDIRVEIGAAAEFRTYYNTFVMAHADTTKPVYPLKGSWTWSKCILRKDAAIGGGDPNLNCRESPVTNSAGVCWRKTAGDWTCNLFSGSTGAQGPLTRPRG